LKSFIDSYYTDAEATYGESQAKISEGEDYNNLVDRLGLVTVVHAVVLFLLGIANSFKATRLNLPSCQIQSLPSFSRLS